MKNKLTMVKTFKDMETNVTPLIKESRSSSLHIETNTSVYCTLDEVKVLFYTYFQEENESNARHLKNFKSIVEVIEHLGVNIFADKTLVEHESIKR